MSNTTLFQGHCHQCLEQIHFEWNWSDGIIDFGVNFDGDSLQMYTTIGHRCPKSPKPIFMAVYEVPPRNTYNQLTRCCRE